MKSDLATLAAVARTIRSDDGLYSALIFVAGFIWCAGIVLVFGGAA